ncbi:MAG: lipid-A-disaccharide synthase [Bacteroidota bacterium]|nr:lipid-A-disaccharide synthase [Bacteroidota bacterium]
MDERRSSGKVPANKRIYMIAGEASGDLHGGNLINALKKLDPSIQIRAWGGDRMQAEGAEVVKHYRELAFMGFAEVIKNLPTILRNLRKCKEDIAKFKPDAVILIDYPGFNLRIAEYAHALEIPIHYYISPQVWAWKKGRVHQIKRVVDHMYVILPFEEKWYSEYGVKVHFIGHPLLDELDRYRSTEVPALPEGMVDAKGIIALLPGSRRQEIAKMLPLMKRMVTHFPEYRFIIAAAPSVPPAVYEELLDGTAIQIVHDRTYDVLRSATAALVTSGTATLEAALLNVPLAICYKGSALNVWLARRMVKVKFIGLVNLIMDREVVRELIQSGLNEGSMRTELQRLIADEAYRKRMLNDFAQLRKWLGGSGASKKVASAVWKTMANDPKNTTAA